MCVWNDDDGDEDDYVDNDDGDDDDYVENYDDDDSAYFKVIIASISIQSVQFSPFQGRLPPLNVPIFCLPFSLRRHLKTHTGKNAIIFCHRFSTNKHHICFSTYIFQISINIFSRYQQTYKYKQIYFPVINKYIFQVSINIISRYQQI